MPKKEYVNASKCHDMLRRLAEQYKELAYQFQDAGKDKLAEAEWENYEAMVRAMTVLVKTHNI